MGNGEMGYNQTILHSLRLFTDPSALSLKKVNISASEASLSSTVNVSWWAPSGCWKAPLFTSTGQRSSLQLTYSAVLFFIWQNWILLRLSFVMNSCRFFPVFVIYYLITQHNVRIFGEMVLNWKKSDVLVDWFWSKLMRSSCGEEPELAANVSRIWNLVLSFISHFLTALINV